MQCFLIDFFHLAYSFKIHPCCNMYQYFKSFLLPNNISLCGYTTFDLPINELTDIWVVPTFDYYE